MRILNINLITRCFFITIISASLLALFSTLVLAQETASNVDDMFLDDSFLDENVSSEPEVLGMENSTSNSDSASTLSGNDVLPLSSTFLTFTITDTFDYIITHGESAHNKDNLIYETPWNNQLIFNNYLQHINAQQWLTFKIDYNLYFTAASLEDKEVFDDLDTNFGYELRESLVRASLWNNHIFFRIGKILRNHGSGYLVNPSNPVLRTLGSEQAWAKNRKFESVDTSVLLPIEGETGTKDEIGYWATEFELLLYPIVWRVAYLPMLETGFAEFDRPDHSVLTTLGVNQWDAFQPSLLLFWYRENYKIGADFSIGVNEVLTSHVEMGLNSENELPILEESNRVIIAPDEYLQHYNLTTQDISALYLELLVGINYTPKYEAQPIVNIIFELYYNGKGLWKEDWDEQIKLLGDIKNNFDYTKRPDSTGDFSNLYKGILGYNQYYYAPLRVRPLYALIRVTKDDIFSTLDQSFNAASNLVYSLLDTTFVWEVELELEMIEVLTIGLQSNYYFGMPHGAFTELTRKVTFSVFSKFKF